MPETGRLSPYDKGRVQRSANEMVPPDTKENGYTVGSGLSPEDKPRLSFGGPDWDSGAKDFKSPATIELLPATHSAYKLEGGRSSSADVVVWTKPKAALKDEGNLNEKQRTAAVICRVPQELASELTPALQAVAATLGQTKSRGRRARAFKKIQLVLDELMQADNEAVRPEWNDKDNPPDLLKLSAPAFLIRVWGDKIGLDGVVVNDDIEDKALVEAVRHYIDGRKGQPDLGDAQGLIIVPSRRGRPKKANEINKMQFSD